MFIFFCPLTRVPPARSQVVINLGLVYKVQHHCGVIFQFVAFVRKRKRMVPDIVAAGGRYDHLVGFLSVWRGGSSGGRAASPVTERSAVGVPLNLSQLGQDALPAMPRTSGSGCLVVVVVVGGARGLPLIGCQLC